MLARLLAAHPELDAEANDIARSLRSSVTSNAVADEVEAAASSLDLEDLGGRAGRHEWGYVQPGEAAWELLHEAVEPFIQDMKQRLDLGLDSEALEIVKGMLLGLYRLRDAEGDDVLGWAPDFPAEHAMYVLDQWVNGGQRQRSGRAHRDAPVLQDFMEEAIPEWSDLIDQAAPRRRKRSTR